MRSGSARVQRGECRRMLGVMEIREFATQILFGETLDDKLIRPDTLTDEQPGAAIVAPKMPGRPKHLFFQPTGTRTHEFPGPHRLEDSIERGRLLHFFANHELLATELMALVLLRFPDAPPAFRRGVVRTLFEEQDHTRLYMERIEACGLQFGELPVNGFFWRSIAPMQSPLDFVAGLSLTFEQANLDYCRFFARNFERVGDTATTRLLDQIYRDEIAHVAHGLKWFRRWKNPRFSDWEAFCHQLKFPLSPNRAKGVEFNEQGRRAAGVDDEFIRELRVHSQSRGRTPSVFWFNPLSEGFMAQGDRFQPVAGMAVLARDLANLPQFVARKDDVVCVPKRPSAEYLNTLQQIGMDLPEFVEIPAGTRGHVSGLVGRKLGRLRPWAWGPDSQRLFGPLQDWVRVEPRPAQDWFNDGVAALYSKAWSAAFLREWLQERVEAGSVDDWLCPVQDVGRSFTSINDALDYNASLRGHGYARCVVKSAFGLAGRNMIRLWEPTVSGAQRRWIERALESGHPVVVEPWLDRIQDFSVQLEFEGKQLRLLGYTGLDTDIRGQYQGSWVEPRFKARIPVPWTALFPQNPRIFPDVHACLDALIHGLETRLLATTYRGPVGIDAFVYRTGDGKPCLKPVVEINPRFTMGRLALELMRHSGPGRFGYLNILRQKHVLNLGFDGFSSYAADLKARNPVEHSGHPISRLDSGVVCLNDPGSAEDCLAVWRVSRCRLERGF